MRNQTLVYALCLAVALLCELARSGRAGDLEVVAAEPHTSLPRSVCLLGELLRIHPVTSKPVKLVKAAGFAFGVLDELAAPTVEELLVGAELDLDLPEFGAVGRAKLVEIAACPGLERGPGRLVTGSFRHEAANVINLWVDGEPEPIGTTANHPFWSEDRHEYVEAGSLKPGERLRTIGGAQTRVLNQAPRGPPETVYNFEVEGVHAYAVGDSGIVVHNACTSTGKASAELAESLGKRPGKGWQAAHIVPTNGPAPGKASQAALEGIKTAKDKMAKYLKGKENTKINGFWAKAGHAGTHTNAFYEDLGRAFEKVKDTPTAKAALAKMWRKIKRGAYL